MVDDENEDQNEDKEDFGALTGDGDESEGGGDSGLGNLPPLSDFDSAEGESDGDLPPLDTPDDEPGETDSPISGLPPIVDIKVDTPAVRPSDLDTPQPPKDHTSSPAGFDTPGVSEFDSPEGSGLGFQDFAADSDFSPETPEIGPGPDSDIETPMFDSAFGGDSDAFGTGGTSSTPTQAMSTPMFDGEEAAGGGIGFDEDAFGAPTPDVGDAGATPIPDFSPDTGMPSPSGATPAVMSPAPASKPPRRGGRMVGILIPIVMLIVGLGAGLFLSPMASDVVPFIPNPAADDLAQKDQEIERLKGQIKQRDRVAEGGAEELSQDELDKLLANFEKTQAELQQATSQLATTQGELDDSEDALELIRADIEEKNGEFVMAQEALEELKNEDAITRARHDGLLAENDRLTEMVGELEDANTRRVAAKDTLLHSLDRLVIQIEAGSPLAPERHDHGTRIAKARSLRDKVSRGKWVSPQLLDEYTDLYLAELDIASSREYFFARIPVHDSLKSELYRWAECLMNGNWSVYYRTIDGNHVGSYENVAVGGVPDYQFREDLPGTMRSDIVQAIESARVEGYEEKIKVLREKQKIYESKTPLQQKFSSL